MGFLFGSVVKTPPASAGDVGSIPDPGRSHLLQSNEAHMPQLLSLGSRAGEPQLLSSCATAAEEVPWRHCSPTREVTVMKGRAL